MMKESFMAESRPQTDHNPIAIIGAGIWGRAAAAIAFRQAGLAVEVSSRHPSYATPVAPS